MQERKAAGFLLEIFIVVLVLGTLSAIAIPRVGQMIERGDVVAREAELHNIQTAVIEMLCDSSTRALEPVGPTADMTEVTTSDIPPLVLADYLGMEDGSLSCSCNYTFAADGKVIQFAP